jgi:hypothetical protein
VQDGSQRQDPEDSVEAFIGDLRKLRDDLTDPPTWDAMDRRAKSGGVRVGKSTLHKIARLDTLPSELAVRGYVTALRRDPADIDHWMARRAAFDTAHAGQPADHPGPEDRTRSPARSRWRLWLAVGAALVITNVVTGIVVYRASTSDPRTPPDKAQVMTGDNPLKTSCLADARVATSTNANPEYLLEILFSAECSAAWARITRKDDRALGNHVEVVIYRRSDPDGTTRQPAVEPDVKSAFTTLIVRSDPTDRLCATGAVITDGTRSAAVDAICT